MDLPGELTGFFRGDADEDRLALGVLQGDLEGPERVGVFEVREFVFGEVIVGVNKAEFVAVDDALADDLSGGPAEHTCRSG